ncbi:MAG: Gfo/Idh/MocA family oxidoreductase [Verrucomicrobiales bacterium]|nr:Gfo/Idh/MocA family oxidoreductase [Verrucomicrobiales bacterium]
MNNKPLPLVIVGLSFGRHILTTLNEPEVAKRFKLAGVCDLRKNVADEEAAKYNVRAYYSLDEVLRDDSVAVVGLYTQPVGRAGLVREIIRAGKDVMTTKPFELDYPATAEVLREAQRLNRVVHLNSPGPQPTPEIQQIQDWIKTHDLGRLVGIKAEVWSSYFDQADGSWMDDPRLCPGGVMMRLGIYLINDIIQLAGAVDQAQLVTSRVRTGRPTPDNAMLTLAFTSGTLASVYASFCIDDGDWYSNGLALHFERGSIYRNIGVADLSPKMGNSSIALVMADTSKPFDEHISRVVERQVIRDEASGQYQWEEFYQAVVNRVTISDEYVWRIMEGVRILNCMQEPGVIHKMTAV